MRWTFKESPDPKQIIKLQDELGIDPILSTLLLQRGISDFEQAKTYFKPDLTTLHDPYLMKDMDKAVERIIDAIDKGERIMVFGDYDVDGTTAVALMSSFLQRIDQDIISYIPHRYDEGYGISYQAIDRAEEEKIPLIIALDCGIKSIEHISYAKEKGIDFIICDHHLPGEEIPDAFAVLDPKRRDCEYPYKELSGCGVGFKLVQALASELGINFVELVEFLDLCAISIGSDIVDVTGENRVLAYFGLEQLNKSPRPGLKALMDDRPSGYTLTDCIFSIGPKINAAGRMEHGLYAVELLMEEDLASAKEKALAIDRFNEERREADKTTTEEALLQIVDLKEEDAPATVVFEENWHKGVIGIVASRLIDHYYRPTLVFTRSGDKLAASARSVKGFDVYKALEQCEDLLEQFGGHKYAAGMTMDPKNYQAFKSKFFSVVEGGITEDQTEPELVVDSPLPFEYINKKFYRILQRMEPFGPGNEKPVFASYGVFDTGFASLVGEDKNHLRTSFSDLKAEKTYQAIGFFMPEMHEVCESGSPLNIAFNLEVNNFRGDENFQLQLKDVKQA